MVTKPEMHRKGAQSVTEDLFKEALSNPSRSFPRMRESRYSNPWMPAFAGMTDRSNFPYMQIFASFAPLR